MPDPQRVWYRVVVRHPGGGESTGDADALEVRVDRDRQAELVCGLPQRVVHGVAVRDARAAREEDADELVASSEPADLARCGLRVLRRHDDHAAQSRFRLQPLLE